MNTRFKSLIVTMRAPICVLSLLMLSLIGPSGVSAAEHKDAALFKTYQKMLDEDPYQPYALRRLLEVSHVAGGLSGLIKIYKTRSTSQRARSSDWVLLGHLYSAADRSKDALEAYKEGAKEKKNDWRPHQAMARLFRKDKAWNAAFKAFDQALQKARQKETRLELWQEAADTSLEAKELKQAQTYFSAMRRAAPRKLFVHMEAAATLARRGYKRAALAAWEELEKSIGKALKHRVVIWRQIATIQEELGELDNAEATWRKGLETLAKSHWAHPAFMEGLISVYRRRDDLSSLVKEIERGSTKARNTRLTLAHLHEELGQDDKAIAWLKKILKKEKRDSDTRLRLIRILERRGQSKELELEYKTLVKYSEGEPRHALKLAALYFQRAKKAKAFKLLKALSKRYANDPGVHQRSIDLTMRYGSVEERSGIERSYRTLMRLEPREEGHIISLGEYWWSQGERDKAKRIWKGLSKANANKSRGQLSHASVLLDHGLLQEAHEAFKKALALEPDNPHTLRAFARFLETHPRMGDPLAIWKRVLANETQLQKSNEARRRVVQLWTQSGRARAKEKELRERLDMKTPDLEAGFYLVELLLTQGHYDDAREVLERLRTLAPDRLEVLVVLERLYARQDRVDDAIQILERLAELNPREAYDYLHRAADLALGQGDLEGALQKTKGIVALNPAAPDAHEVMGELYVQMGKTKEAVSAWRQVLLLDPRNDTIRFKLAELYRAMNKPKREREELTHIVRETTQPADVLKAGKRLLEVAIASGGLREVEEAIKPLVMQRSERSEVYLKLLIDIFLAQTRAIRWTNEGQDAEVEPALKALGERALKPLIEAISGSDVAMRARALEIIEATLPAGAVPALSRLLLAHESLARVSVAGTLASIGTPSALRSLEQLYESSTGHAQRVATWALGLAEAPEALTILKKIASARQAQHRILAAWAMGVRADVNAIDTLAKLARSADLGQRVAALWALSQTPTSAIESTCASALRSKDPLERQLAAQALARIPTRSSKRRLVNHLWSAEGRPEGHLKDALTYRIKPHSREQIKSAYRGLVDPIRGRISENKAPLISTLVLTPSNEDDQIERVQALLPLLQERLRNVLEDGSELEMERLLESCLDHQGKLALRPLLSHTQEPPKLAQLVNALWRGSEDKLRQLAIGSEGVNIRAHALRLLARLREGAKNTKSVQGALEALQSPWPEVQAAALMVLTNADVTKMDKGTHPLTKVVLDWYDEEAREDAVRHALAEGIMRSNWAPSQKIDETLKALLRDPLTKVRLAAVKSAHHLDRPSLIWILGERTSDPVADVARAAIEALRGSSQSEAKELLRRLSHRHRSSPTWQHIKAQSITSP